MRNISNEIKLDFDDVLIEPQRSTLTSRSNIELVREFRFYHSTRIWNGIPIMCANMSFCSFEIAKKLAESRMLACLHKYHTVDELTKYFKDNPENIPYTWVTIGCKQGDLNKLLELKSKLKALNIEKPNICIDVPNGHMDVFVKYCKSVRESFPESIIMAGNVTNASSTQELIVYGGIDICKVGIGGGSACTTRMVAGCGVPQLSAIIENSYVAHGQQNKPRHLGLICSDGGHKNVGDVCKSLCAGSDFVMLGGYWAGCDECIGEWNNPDGSVLSPKYYFTYYGMSTHYSQEQYEDTLKDYRASEGTKISICNKGPIQKLIQELLGGIRSCCCYIGASSIKDMNKCASFCRVNKIHNNSNPILGG